MKYLYQGVAEILTNDADLIALLEYTATNDRIRRGYTTEGNWNKLVAFYVQPETVNNDFTAKIREVPLIVRVYDRVKDLNCSDIAERIITLLDGADLSVAGKIHVYNCSYTGALIPLKWDDKLKSLEKVLRFQTVFRVDGT